MRSFTATELDRMQTTQESAMQDTCVLLARTEGATDDYGYPAVTWTTVDTVDCGFRPLNKGEFMGDAEVDMPDAKLRLSIDNATDTDNFDRVQITHRFGVALTAALTFEIIGSAERGPSGLVLNLRLVTDGSDA